MIVWRYYIGDDDGMIISGMGDDGIMIWCLFLFLVFCVGGDGMCNNIYCSHRSMGMIIV